MKKIVSICLISLGFMIFGASIYLYNADINQENKNSKNSTDNAVSTATQSNFISKDVYAAENKSNEPLSTDEISSKYMVKEYKGKIAVFEDGQNKPFRITDIAIKDLPKADKEFLEKGISVSGKEELNQILEDYCS